MKRYIQRFIFQANRILNKPLTIAVILLFLFIYFAIGNAQFQKDNRQLLSDTKRAAENSETLLKNQQQLLDAIRQVTLDTKMTAEQQTAIIICMLQVPINQRTTDTLAGCRKQTTSSSPAQQSNQSHTPQNTSSQTKTNNLSTNSNNSNKQGPVGNLLNNIIDVCDGTPLKGLC